MNHEFPIYSDTIHYIQIHDHINLLNYKYFDLNLFVLTSYCCFF